MKKPDKKAENMTMEELASYIDYSVLKPEFTQEEIIELTKDGVAKSVRPSASTRSTSNSASRM